MAPQSSTTICPFLNHPATCDNSLQDYEGAKYDVTCCLFLEPSNRSIMSLFSRLYPEKSVEDVLQSSTGILAAQSVQQAVSEAFPTLWSNYSVELKGNNTNAFPSSVISSFSLM